MTERETLERAARAVGWVDAMGERGIEALSQGHIVAMALTLIGFGLVPIAPGATAPERLIITQKV